MTEGLEERRRAWIEKPQLRAWRRWRSGESDTPWGSQDAPEEGTADPERLKTDRPTD